MLARTQHLVLIALGALALVLALASAALVAMNQSTQGQIAERQQYVQQSIALETLYREIVKGLAESAARSDDRALLAMLAAQGLNVTVTGTETGTNAASAPGAVRRP